MARPDYLSAEENLEVPKIASLRGANDDVMTSLRDVASERSDLNVTPEICSASLKLPLFRLWGLKPLSLLGCSGSRELEALLVFAVAPASVVVIAAAGAAVEAS